MIEMTKENIERYLREALGEGAILLDAGTIGNLDEQGLKDFGYGRPLLVRWERKGKLGEAVISAMRGDKYGHQDYWDRARITLFQYEASKLMPRHVRPLGVGYVNAEGRLVPMRDVRELFIVNEKIEGSDYFLELERIRESGEATEADLELTRAFARWLAEIHAEKNDAEPDRYHRRIRNLIGDCECIYGIVDGYPHPYAMFNPERFQALEKRLVDWRWKLKAYTHRLAAVHGDFHPWNVLVRTGDDGAFDFGILDRSRGVWGEPADDVATMSMNYLLYGLLDGAIWLKGPFKKLYMTFWEAYLEATGDTEMAQVIAPFYVFRGLVVASPEWYPRLDPQVRQALFALVENVLEEDEFRFEEINRYLRRV